MRKAFGAALFAATLLLPAGVSAQLGSETGADRIVTAVPILLAAGLVATLLAWGTIAGHAIRIARANPVLALRYE